MAKKSFIFQGIRNETHAAAISSCLKQGHCTGVLLSFAFVNAAGVNLLKSELSAVKDKLKVYAGIRNDITTIQGMEALRNLGAELYAFDTGSRGLLFHPKICLVRFKDRADLIVGSANLTLGGLNNNVEAGIRYVFDLSRKSDLKIVDSIEADFEALSIDHPQNVTRVKTSAQLDDMLKQGRLVDETTAPAPRARATAQPGAPLDKVPRLKLKVTPIRIKITRAKKVAAKKAAQKAAQPGIATTGISLELVWESKALTRRDLNIPTAGNTNATGSINLDKGLLEASIDHRHYFRDEVFSALTWTTRSSTVDEAKAQFKLVIKGVDRGTFLLTIRHTTSTKSKAYMQKNAMTRLSWGLAHTLVAKATLIGRNLALYRDTQDPTNFVLEID